MTNHNAVSDINIDESSSEDEGEVIPKVVENYYFTDENQESISLTVLPYDMDGDENNKGGSKNRVFLEGTADGGLQKVYKQAIAWKVNLQQQKPVLCAMIKERIWIQLRKPRKNYAEIIRSLLVSAHFLHFARRNPEAAEKAYWEHLRKVFSTSDDKPAKIDLLEHYSLIKDIYHGDKKLKKADVLNCFVEMKSKRKLSNEDGDINPKAKKAKFLVSDEEFDEDLGEDGLDESDEEDDLFDSVCAICDNGGELLCCEGPCMRSFHPNRDAGEDSSCKSLGLSKAQIEEMQNFYCLNCKYKQHQCFSCGKLGSSDKTSREEVFCCVSATCGHFYHPKCVSTMIAPEAEAEEFEKKIADGLQFTCPVHRCHVCKQTEQKEDEDMQFAICRRCPIAYHRKCLPEFITFEETDGEPQRAWEDLIPNRILIYCRKHKVDPELLTPRRNHITFPEMPSAGKIIKRNRVISPESRVGKTVGKTVMKLLDSTKEKVPVDSIKEKVSLQSIKEKVSPRPSAKKEKSTLSGHETTVLKVCSAYELPKNVTKETKALSVVREEDKQSMLEIKKSLGQRESKPKGLELNKSKTIKELTTSKQDQKKPTIVLPKFTENDIKTIVMDIVERSTAAISLSDVYAKHQVPSTHRSSVRNLDKSITKGKVEGSVKAVRTALKKLEEGGNTDDAKAVCGPDILCQMLKWKNKLNVYLAPFLHGMRYTSYGRHFTEVPKLQEVVERLHWYVQNGDMIVDFCCGANDFSRLMKAKLENCGKKCLYKNFDIFQPKDDFEFQKRDWMSVDKNELETGDRLIMGLNPPFGVNGAQANKFIDKALQFGPKLLILIVPKETKRLDEKRERYDLVWEDLDLLKGKSFYLPGSVDVDDKKIGQWNKVPPPLYLWSRPDWTVKHRAIAINQGHVRDHTIIAEPEVSVIKPSQPVEEILGPGKHAEKAQQGSAFGIETVNNSSVDYRKNERESKPDSVSLVHKLDGLRQKDVSLTKIKDEHREFKYERHIIEKKNHEDKICDQRKYEIQREGKDSDMFDHGRSNLHSEPDYMSRLEKGGHKDEYGHHKHQKEKSPVKERERADPVERERHKGRYDQGKHENEKIASSLRLKKLDVRKDGENEHNAYMQEQGSFHINATDGRAFDKRPANRGDHVRGFQIGADQLGQRIERGFQGILPGDVEEDFGRGYHRMSGGGEDSFGRVHRDGSEDYGRGIQFSRSGNVDEEYAPAEAKREFSRRFPRLESGYSVSPDLKIMQNNKAYNRQAQYDYDSENSRLLQDIRAPGDSQRSRYDTEKDSHVNDAYVPEVHNSLMLGQQHEKLSHHLPRGTYHSEAYRRSELTSSAMQCYAPCDDQNTNYTRSTLRHIDQAHGFQSFPFDPLAFAPGLQTPYPHQNSSGWIDE